MTAADDPRLEVDYKNRDCYRADGLPKRTLSRKQAKALAKQKGSGLVAYRCTSCPWWHTATKRSETPRSIP